MKLFLTTITYVLILLLAMATLIYFDVNTLFLVTLLGAIVAVKNIKADEKETYVDKFIGIGFALSVSPSAGVPIDQLTILSNGFVIQSLLSALLFVYFIKTKPSIIGRIYREAKGSVGIVLDDVLAGFAAGISSSLLWQAFLFISQKL